MTVVRSGASDTVFLPAQHVLIVVASNGTARVTRNDVPGYQNIASGVTLNVGPFAEGSNHTIEGLTGVATYSIASVDFPTAAEGDTSAAVLIATAKAEAIATAASDATTKASAAQAAAQAAVLAALPSLAMPVVGSVGDLREVIGAGAPAASAAAELDVNPAGDDNGLTFTAKVFGAGGNLISVEYVDPSANDAPLSVDVAGSVITVNLATGVAGAITSTAAEVLAAIEASGPADALVAVAIDTGDTGVADDGSGIVTAMAAAFLAGGTGVGVGVAGTGSRYTDVTAGKFYINGGTKAEPVWNIVTSA